MTQAVKLIAHLLVCLIGIAIAAALISLGTPCFLDPWCKPEPKGKDLILAPAVGTRPYNNTGYYQSAPDTITFVRGGQALCTVEPPNVDGGIPRVPPEAMGGCCKLVAVECKGERLLSPPPARRYIATLATARRIQSRMRLLTAAIASARGANQPT